MKKVLISVLMFIVVLIAGCLDYKTYQPSGSGDDSSLVDEIAQIEAELNKEKLRVLEAEETEENKSEMEDKEVILPAMEEEVLKETEKAADYQIIKVKENQLVALHVNVTDPDKDKVAYTFSTPLNQKGEWQTKYGDAGEYLVTITASDGKLTSEKKVKLVVERVNIPPTVSGVRNLTISEGERVSFTPIVSDDNKDQVTVTMSAPLTNGTWVTDHTSAGKYTVRITATDGEAETLATFTLTVNDVNIKPEITNLPTEIKVKEGETVRVESKVTDLDGDKVTVSITDPVGDDGIWETEYTDHGQYAVTITANDGKDAVSRKVTVIVEDQNMPPQIVGVQVSSE